MNIKHSVNVPALSGKRSMLRRLVTAATMGALMLGVVSASADGGGGKGSYSLEGTATGGIAVKGDGKFKIRDVDGKLVFDSKIGGCADIQMKDKRQKHTCDKDDSKIAGMKPDSIAKLVVEKSAIKFPEAGKSSSGKAPGKVHFLEKSSDVTIEYEISEKGGKYKVSKASFVWTYTKHTNEVCLAVVCVKPDFKITVTDAEIDAKK